MGFYAHPSGIARIVDSSQLSLVEHSVEFFRNGVNSGFTIKE